MDCQTRDLVCKALHKLGLEGSAASTVESLIEGPFRVAGILIVAMVLSRYRHPPGRPSGHPAGPGRAAGREVAPGRAAGHHPRRGGRQHPAGGHLDASPSC